MHSVLCTYIIYYFVASNIGVHLQPWRLRIQSSSSSSSSKALEEAVLKAQEEVARQGDVVRGLKAEMKDGRVVRVRILF